MNNNQSNNTSNNSGCGIIVFIVIVILIIIGIFGGDDSSSSSSNKYSNDYNTDKEYRDDVNHIADVFGKDADEVDRKIQAAADAANNR